MASLGACKLLGKLLQMNHHALLDICDCVALFFVHMNLSCFLTIPNVLAILQLLICLPLSFPRVRPLNNSLEACRHSRLSDHMMHFRDYVP